MSTRVLIVEDSPTQAARLKHVLSGFGYEIEVASGAKEAIELAKGDIPDILVSDVNMPEMDGYELCRAVRGDSSICDIPILLLTGMSDPQDIILGLDAGADSYLTKPYEESELASRINFVLSNVVEERVASSPLEVNFLGKQHSISASRAQMLGLLLSTYESAAQQNKRLNREQLNLKMVQREQDRKLRKLESSSKLITEAIKTVVKDSREPAIVVNSDGDFIDCNKVSVAAFGANSEGFFSKSVSGPPSTWNGQVVRWADSNGKKISGTIQVIDIAWEGRAALLIRLQKNDE